MAPHTSFHELSTDEGAMKIGLNRLSLMALVATIATAAGCAEERDPISRVQPMAMPKSFFVGQKLNDPSDDPQFYGRSILVQVDYGSVGEGLFSGGYNTVNRIRWTVEENYLLGHLAYERIQGTDGSGTAKPAVSDPHLRENNDGEVVYKFPILSHFDIRRAYNASTGEEQNVIEENTQDRPWYEREYFRVDWTKNENTSSYKFDLLSMLGLFGVEYSPAAYTASNPNYEDAPVFDLQGGYFDATARVYAKPQMLADYGIPACWVPNFISGGSAPVESCNEHQLTVRHAFKRVVDDDYEPAHWDGQRFEMYGAFTVGDQDSEIGTFDPSYGLRDSGRFRGIQRYNIWKQSHAYSDAEKREGATSCTADADCAEVSPASRCDTYRGKNICTLPYTQRETKPVVFHYVQGGDPTYFDATRDAIAQWDAALRLAVASARTAECKAFGLTEGCGNVPVHGNFAHEEDLAFLVGETTACRSGLANGGKDCEGYAESVGTARGYAEEVIALAQEKPMVVLCHSPVEKGDDPLCGPEKTIARMGDLRYNIINAIPQPEINGPWGIMTDANDPETGEKVSANVTSYVAINDKFATDIVDRLRYIAGELGTADISSGAYIEKYRDAAIAASNGASMPLYKSSELHQRLAVIAGGDSANAETLLRQAQAFRASKPDAFKKLTADVGARAASLKSMAGVPSVNAALFASRRETAKNTPVEAALVTPAMMQLGGVFGSTQADIDRSSVFRTLNPQLFRDLRQRKELVFAQRGICEMNADVPAPLSYAGIRSVLEQKFGAFDPKDPVDKQAERANRMKVYIRRKSHASVIAHELGHSFGLRHNFVSSTDALNFRPQYWQLRTNNGKTTTECTDAVNDGASCVGPRYFDPQTDEENKGLINMWAHSSIMEYPGEVTQDFLNLGRYDYGAARMFYGDTVGVIADKDFAKNSPKGSVFQKHGDEFGGLLGMRPTDTNGSFHYSQLQSRLGLIRNCKEVDPSAFKPESWDEEKNGAWNPLLDGHLVTVGGKTTRCDEPALEYVPYRSLKTDTETSTFRQTPAMFDGNRVRWTHGFATDQWADLGNVSVYRHDSGADLYEQLNFWIASQELNHIFTSYRRGNRNFNVRSVVDGNMARYHEKMRDAAKALGLYATLARDTTVGYGPVLGANPTVAVAAVLSEFPENALASAIAFDHFTHVFARPQPGVHSEMGPEAGTPFAVQRSCDDTGFAQCGLTSLLVPNGVTGNTFGFGTFELAGRPVNNALADNMGRDYDSEYFVQAGSYYEKAYTAMLFTESADNFISSSRGDFVDPRYRAVSMADVFPDGFRRWLGNNLTGDDFIKGVRAKVASDKTAQIGWTSWWPTEGPRSCFPNGPANYCFTPGTDPGNEPAGLSVVDPQVGWEQQRFAYILSLLHIQDNQWTNWASQMQLWELGTDADPGFENRIEFHSPNGKTYVAKTFGTEVIFGKTVQRGIAARVLEYANELLKASYDVDPVVSSSGTVGYRAKVDKVNQPLLKNGASCAESTECTRLQAYESLPAIMRESLGRWGFMPIAGLK